MTMPEDQSPSLNDSEARGGDINEGGLNFQAAVTLSHIPDWLAREGFTSMIREAIFDTEAQFFVPRFGLTKEALEVKDHTVTPTEFWKEIEQFRKVDTGSPNTYQWFTLASAGLSTELHPLKNSLRRIRDPYGFYKHNPRIIEASYNAYLEAVKRLGRDETAAEFLFCRVRIEDDWSLVKSHWQGVFIQSLNTHLPYHRDLSSRAIEDIYKSLTVTLQGKRNMPIVRKELEAAISNPLPSHLRHPVQPVRMFTAIDSSPSDTTLLQFEWAKFFGGSERRHVVNDVWNTELIGQLNETEAWIAEHRETKRIQLDGQRRLSASIAIGYTFSSVAGYSIEMIHRNQVWATDDHPSVDTSPYVFQVQGQEELSQCKRLVVSIGIQRDIITDVERSLEYLGLNEVSVLHLYGQAPFESAKQVNLAVREAKRILTQAIQVAQAKQIDLFIAGPSQLALFLGHRINAIAPIQCYEVAGDNKYVPTCLLR